MPEDSPVVDQKRHPVRREGAIYWRDVAAYWLQVCEMHHARESSAYTVS